jgi:ATP-binding cassette, subfamily C, bacterial
MEAAECGAAALAIVLAHYRRFVPLAEVRRECGVSRDGSRASNIVSAARYYGFDARGFMMPAERVGAIALPAIVFWNFNHFVVVEGFGHDRVYLNDPATGPRTVTTEEFEESYTGVTIVLTPTDAFRAGGRRPSVIPAVLTRLRGSGAALLGCVLIGWVLVLPGLAIPALTQAFVDNVLIERIGDWVRPLLIGMLLTAAFRAVCLRLQLGYLRRLRTKLAVTASSRFVWHILRLPAAFYAQRYAGEVSSRTALNDRVAETLSGRLATIVIDVTMMLFYFVVMLRYDAVLTAIALAAAAAHFAALQWIARRRMDASVRLSQEQGKVDGVAIGALQNVETLKASALESNVFTRFTGSHARMVNAQSELGLVTVTLGFVPGLAVQAAAVLVLVVGALRIIDGRLTVGMLVAFQSLMQSFLTPINKLVNLSTTAQDLRADLNRLEDVLDNPTDAEANRTDAQPITAARLEGHIEIRNVTFGYSRSDPPLIEHFSATISPGQRLALVGASGSGKSTILRLVCGLYTPWEGEILLDGRPRHEIPRQVLAASLALLEQDVFIFEGTVRDNLTFWREGISDRVLEDACRDAAILEFVRSLPARFDAELREGATNVSGGQRQRFEIARALVNDPSIIVADEATSALDGETEQQIISNLRRRGCSCVIAAHRLSTVRQCDEIIVLDRGKVVQRGTHDVLRGIDGPYSRLLLAPGEALIDA